MDREVTEEIVMDRFTQFKANFPPIREPRWKDNTILINADGSRMFPETLYVSGRTAKKYKAFKMPTGAGGTISIRAIPIKEFKILKISERSLHDF